MNSSKFFFEAANELMNCLAQLSRTTEFYLGEAEDALCRQHDYPPGTDLLAGFGYWDLPVIGRKIEEVMAAFDMLCEESGGEPRFHLAFNVFAAPRRVQRKLQRLLDRIPPEQRQRPPL